MVSLLLLRRYADVSMLFVSLMIIGAVNALKLIVDRPRPDHQIFEPVESSLSFPSGHSLLAVILGGVLIYLVGLWVKPILARRIIQAALILVIIGMGMSRVYMGVHWPSDVIGSYMSGLLALVALIGLRNAVASDP
jgi:undecaprenyl-diphosphatase